MTDERLTPTQSHSRCFRNQQYVYPVLSRRARGISIGVNLSRAKRCNFRCVYCQVSRPCEGSDDSCPEKIDLVTLGNELRSTAKLVIAGSLFDDKWFSKVPPAQRFLRDFAISGDGEPTIADDFVSAANLLLDIRKELELESVKPVLITNATRLKTLSFVPLFDRWNANRGEIWAKLDAGSEENFARVNRSSVPFVTVLDNITFAAGRWSVLLQTMLMRCAGQSPTKRDILTYCRRITEMCRQGATFLGVQLYTLARCPDDSRLGAVPDDELSQWATFITDQTGIAVEPFFSR